MSGGRPGILHHDAYRTPADLLQAHLHVAWSSAAGGGLPQRHRFGAGAAVGEVRHRIDGDQLALADDDDALAGSAPFRQNVGVRMMV